MNQCTADPASNLPTWYRHHRSIQLPQVIKLWPWGMSKTGPSIEPHKPHIISTYLAINVIWRYTGLRQLNPYDSRCISTPSYLESIQWLTFGYSTIDVSIIEFIIKSVATAARRHDLETFLVEHNHLIVLLRENRRCYHYRLSFLNINLIRTDTILINDHTLCRSQY